MPFTLTRKIALLVLIAIAVIVILAAAPRRAHGAPAAPSLDRCTLYPAMPRHGCDLNLSL